MAPTVSKMIGRGHPPPKKSFFVPRGPSQLQPAEPESQPRERRPGTRRNYDQMQKGGGDVLLTPKDARSASTEAAFAAAGNSEDTIVVDAPPGHEDFFLMRKR